jgi:hypothetical protein
MAGPKFSNRQFRIMKDLNIPKGTELVIEIWPGSDWDKEKGCAIPVPGASDIKLYKRSEEAKYNKGDQMAFMRVFNNVEENSGNPFE